MVCCRKSHKQVNSEIDGIIGINRRNEGATDLAIAPGDPRILARTAFELSAVDQWRANVAPGLQFGLSTLQVTGWPPVASVTEVTSLAHVEVGPELDLLPPFGAKVRVYVVAVEGTTLTQIVIASVARQITSELPCSVAGPPIVFPPADRLQDVCF